MMLEKLKVKNSLSNYFRDKILTYMLSIQMVMIPQKDWKLSETYNYSINLNLLFQINTQESMMF